MDKHHSNIEHAHSYTIYILVWMSLLTLTGVTVAVAGINFGSVTIAAALAIASIKSYLVLKIFMHLRLEMKAFRVFVVVALFFIIISFALLFADYSYMSVR
jgi:cytochrome c oxidase subunit IV